MAFCSSHLQPHWWLEGLLPWAVIWIIWFWAFSLTSYFHSYLMLLDLGDSWVCASATHTQNCARPCSLLCGCGQGFQLHLLRPAVCSICFIAALPQHIPYLRYLQCPAVSSSLAVIRISWVTYRCAIPCRPLVKTCWDPIACSPISPSLALGSVVQHHSNVCESSSKVLYIILYLICKNLAAKENIEHALSHSLHVFTSPQHEFPFRFLQVWHIVNSGFSWVSELWQSIATLGVFFCLWHTIFSTMRHAKNKPVSSIYSITKDSFIIWYHMLLWYIFFVIVACSGHQFHKFSVRLLTHNSVAVVNGLLQSQPCWGGKQRWNDLKHSENIWWNHPLHQFASLRNFYSDDIRQHMKKLMHYNLTQNDTNTVCQQKPML